VLEKYLQSADFISDRDMHADPKLHQEIDAPHGDRRLSEVPHLDRQLRAHSESKDCGLWARIVSIYATFVDGFLLSYPLYGDHVYCTADTLEMVLKAFRPTAP
jgi:hypothetical protein